MRKSALLVLACLCIFFTAQLGRTAFAVQTEDVPRASALLDTAEWNLELNDPATAQTRILEAVAAAHTNADIKARARQLWARAAQQLAASNEAKVAEQKLKENEQKQKENEQKLKESERKKQNQLARLEEAERKAMQGEGDKAATDAFAVLGETTDEEVVKRAKQILENNEPRVGIVPAAIFCVSRMGPERDPGRRRSRSTLRVVESVASRVGRVEKL